MMNLFKLSEQLKDLSKDQLVREMKAPSGTVPQFLVMSELQRRTRMEREAMTAEPAAQTTVAQDTVAAAGAPQGGLAQMAQALAPKTDMTENSGIAAMAPQMPAQRMQEGGRVGGPRTAEERFLAALHRNDYLAGEELSGLQANLTDVPRYRGYEPGMGLEATGLHNIGTALARGIRRLRGGEPVSDLDQRASELERYLRTLRIMRESLPPGEDSLTTPRDVGDVPRIPPVQRMQVGGEVEGPNTARLRSLIDLQRALEEARVQTDVNRQRILRAGREDEPRIADVEPLRIRLPEGGRDITPVDEFSGLPPSMTEPGIGGVEPFVSDVEVAPTGGSSTRRDTRSPAPVYTEMDLESVSPGSRISRPGSRNEYPMYTEEDLEAVSPGSGGVREDSRGPRPMRPVMRPGPTFDMEDIAETFEEEALADDRARVTEPATPETEDAPGGPGGGAGGGTDLDRLYEQDRWLSLARFGLGLMSSREPTLGGAIGEAGANALDYMAGARESMMDRRMQERELALQEQALALRGASNAPQIPASGVGLLDAQIQGLTERLTSVTQPPTPAERDLLTTQLERLAAQRDALRMRYFAQFPGALEMYLGAGSPAAPDSIPDFSD